MCCLCLWCRWCSGRRACCTVGPAALCARGRRPARSPALLCPARSPAAAWPARPLAVRAASFARRVVSKPGQAPQAPRRPPIGRCLSLVCCRLVSATAHGHRSQFPSVPPAPSAPVGPGVLMRIHIIAEPTPNSACNSPTTLSNPEIRSLELQRFLTLLKLHPIELHATFLRQPQPPPTGTAARPAGACGLEVALVLDRKLCFG